MSDFVNKVILFPYYAVLSLRNNAYDKGHRKVTDFSQYGSRVISIGNIAAGGTGKTPHVEMFIRHFLAQRKSVAVVSRGYKRKGKDELEVTTASSAAEVGDEPLQMKKKFPQVKVVVNIKREVTVEALINPPIGEMTDIVILDDAHQYRSLKAGRTIVLIDYSHPLFKDNLLPIGSLRDLPTQVRRADTVIFTRCPYSLNEWEREKVKAANKINHHQKVFFTTIHYQNPIGVFPEADPRFIYSQDAMILTGIADDTSFRSYLSTKYNTIYCMKYPDHHYFSKSDVSSILSFAKKHPLAVIMTTEKDAQRLSMMGQKLKSIAPKLFYVPIEMKLLEGDSDTGLYN